MQEGFAVVLDIGKTLTKLTVWSRDGQMLDRYSRPNAMVMQDGIARLDEAGIRAFLIESLRAVSDQPVDYIIPVAHGAGVAAITHDRLAYLPIDYEQEPPSEINEAYGAQRDPFDETGSPALPACLNFGKQLFWADRLYPDVNTQATFMPWPQYWAWVLSGVAASEVSSLGCHSDVWNPARADYSTFAKEQGWAARFAPIRRASDIIGTLRPELAQATGLPASVRILTGVHDSNAALLAARGFPEIDGEEATILSTGTWFVAMRLPKKPLDFIQLPESRDCLVNIDVFGRPVPSARFMGGREIERLIEIDTRRLDIKPDQQLLLEAVDRVVSTRAMVLPTLTPGIGPFADHISKWVNRPDDWTARRAATGLYAALVADTSLDLIGAHNRILVEGRFAEAEIFVRALTSLRPDTQIYVANADNDVSFGALRLVNPALKPDSALRTVRPLDQSLIAYREAWFDNLSAHP